MQLVHRLFPREAAVQEPLDDLCCGVHDVHMTSVSDLRAEAPGTWHSGTRLWPWSTRGYDGKLQAERPDDLEHGCEGGIPLAG